MFRKNDAEKPVAPKRCDPQETNVRIYSLESIMGLQKALEDGIELDEMIPQKDHPPFRHPNEQNISTNPIQRLHKLLAGMLGGLGPKTRLTLSRKSKFRRTSAQ